MKVSIITVVYNNRKYISGAIESVLSQIYTDIEYIIVDGGSTDGTIEVTNSYKSNISKFISEPDNGIYDAMNKGIKLATGDIVGFLNSDDFYPNERVISEVVNTFENNDIACLYGDLIYVNANNINKIVRYWKSQSYKNGLFKKGWHPPHPTFFVKKEIYEKYGYFNVNYKIAGDYEIMLRFLESCNISTFYIPQVLVKMRVGGKSNKNIKNIIKANIECYKAWKENGLKISPFFIIKKPLSKLSQLIYKNKNRN